MAAVANRSSLRQEGETVSDTIDTILSDFAKVVEDAEKVKGQGTDARVIKTKADALVGLVEETAEKGVRLPDEVLGSLPAIRALSAALSGLSGDSDREKGSSLAERATALVTAGILNQDQGTMANELLARWKDAKVTFRSKTGANASPDLGFKVEVKDGNGKVVASTRKHNVNSLRSQVKLAGKHDWDKDNPAFVGLTEAIKLVMDGGVDTADGGGYIVHKVAESVKAAA
jgi:hypothetical protein